MMAVVVSATVILTFDLPIEQNTTLAGAVTVRLTFSCNEIDSYILARLSSVDTDGIRHQLSIGAVRPTACTEDPSRSTSIEIVHDTGRRTPLVPGESVEVRFSLTAFRVLLRAGERLRMDVGSRSDLLREDPADGFVQFDLPVPPYLCRNTLHFGGLSWIDVGEVPTTAAIRPHRGNLMSTDRPWHRPRAARHALTRLRGFRTPVSGGRPRCVGSVVQLRF